MYTDETTYPNPVGTFAWDSPQYAGLIVISAMLFLYAIRRGFRPPVIGR
jgi:hypothetical protein